MSVAVRTHNPRGCCCDCRGTEEPRPRYVEARTLFRVSISCCWVLVIDRAIATAEARNSDLGVLRPVRPGARIGLGTDRTMSIAALGCEGSHTNGGAGDEG